MGAIREYLKIHPPDNTKHKPIYACVEFAQDSIISDIDRLTKSMAEGKTETTANRIYVAPPV